MRSHCVVPHRVPCLAWVRLAHVQLASVLATSRDKLAALTAQIREFQQKYNIRVMRPEEAEAAREQQMRRAAAAQADEGAVSSVLA